MPALLSSHPRTTASSKAAFQKSLRNDPNVWPKFFTQCLARRLGKEQFQPLFIQLHRDVPIRGRRVADHLFDLPKHAPLVADPLMLPYVESLLDSGIVNCGDILASLYARSKYRPQPTDAEKANGHHEFPKNIG